MVMLVTGTLGSVTVTAHVACTPLPSLALHVTVALPLDLAVTLPLLSTVAMLVLLDDHVTVLSVALSGETVAVSVPVELTKRASVGALLMVTLVTGIMTVTVQVAVTPLPSLAVALTQPVPGVFPSIRTEPSSKYFEIISGAINFN